MCYWVVKGRSGENSQFQDFFGAATEDIQRHESAAQFLDLQEQNTAVSQGPAYHEIVAASKKTMSFSP
jgi:hypothetical protein